ncbi:MAG: type II toxin-antitoxin system death-on-curing family toxin [Gammaproteobacteria bacterium]|nr:type II toxin-antitoxin system death-on-curing family toxin [Gammaproteobacteria bacterium]
MSGAEDRVWRWVAASVVYAIHERQLAEHGGKEGIRDQGAIESALARPVNKSLYQETDAAGLAAAYAYGLARNHGFNDGNKRTAWVVARVFLADNGKPINFDRLEAIQTMERVAAGSISEEALAEWLRLRLER